jgi:putative DNA primase/helicase
MYLLKPTDESAIVDPTVTSEKSDLLASPISTDGDTSVDEPTQYQSAIELISRMIDAAKTDCGAPFEPAAIDALRLVQSANPPEFQRIRTRIKRANKDVSMLNFDRALNAKFSNDVALIAQTHHGYASDVIRKLTVNGCRPVGFEGELYAVNPDSNLWQKIAFDFIVAKVTDHHDGKDNCARGSDYRAIAQHVISIVTDDKFFTDAPVGLATPEGFYQIERNRCCAERDAIPNVC